jgi:RimJ/RimL family protein N-acetyltransferase
MKMIIETPRLALRLLNENDADMIIELLNEEAFINNIGDKQVRTKQDALNYINNGPLAMQRDFGFSLYCCVDKVDGQTIGLSGMIKRMGIEHPEVGFAFLGKYCRLGYGFESADAVITHATKHLGIKHLQAICNPDNNASVALLTRLDFSFNKNINLEESDKVVMLFDRNV